MLFHSIKDFLKLSEKPKSWLHSVAWEIMQTFKEKLLICFAENDSVIPKEIIEKPYDNATIIQNSFRRK